MHRTYLSTAVKGCLLIGLSLVFTGRIFAGTCPSGAYYLNTTNPSGSLVTLSSLGITTCYYIAANGSDSNDGASEASGHPWAHAPGMSTCSNNCASNTPSGGVGYIFRGGDTWHFGNSSLSPYTNGWIWSWSGTSQSVPIYIGVDPTWYSGSSWARPIINGDNPTQACPGTGPCPVSSCSYAAIGGNYNQMISFNGKEYNVIDNFEFTGLCWNQSTYVGNNYIAYYGPSQSSSTQYAFVAENLYVHGWTFTSGLSADGAAISGNASYCCGVTQFCVLDGSDSDDTGMSPLGPNDADAWIVRFNFFSHWGADTVSSDCHYIDDNVFQYYNFKSGHGDNMFCESTWGGGGSSSPNLFYNNVFRYIGTEYGQSISYVLDLGTPSGQTDYIFNNIWHDNNPTASGSYVATEGKSGSWVLFNNTGEMMAGGTGCLICNGSGSSPITSVNNHWISANGQESDIYQSTSNVTESTTTYMRPSIASSQGYTSSNDFSPTASTNSTVTAAGTNETTNYCADTALHSAPAEAACVNGTSKGVGENTTNYTVIVPGITLVPRPSSGSWNTGAYQLGSGSTGSTPSAPSNLAATVNP